MYAATFLMRDGRVANLDRHLARLREETAFDPGVVEEVRDKLRAAGDGVFRPHIQVVGSSVDVQLHPTVLPADEVVVNAEGIRDQRRHPTSKGPDFGWQVRELQRIRQAGADAGLLVDDRGYVISGIFSAVLYRDGGTAHISAHPRAAYSTTLDSVLEILAEAGVDIVEHPDGFPVTRLRGPETWLLSSLEGVRKITGWLEYGSVMGPRGTHAPRGGAPTHREVNDRLWQLAEPV